MLTHALLIVLRGLLVSARSGGPRRPEAAVGGRPAAGTAAAENRLPAHPGFALPATRPLLRRDRAFLARFGFDPARVAQVRIYADPGPLDGFPVPLRDCLQRLASEGRCRGPEIAGLVFSGRALAIGEQLYFAMLRPAVGDPELVAFIDRVRL